MNYLFSDHLHFDYQAIWNSSIVIGRVNKRGNYFYFIIKKNPELNPFNVQKTFRPKKMFLNWGLLRAK